MQSHLSNIFLSFYGDDFTGSTDAMEALTLNGLRTVLFMEVPTQEDLINFPDVDCIGIAGNSRVMTPLEMERELKPILIKLKNLGSKFVHYKVCSTFDSSKEVGNIAQVIKLARQIYDDQTWVPVVVGSPELQRYTLFGNHFAYSGDQVFRLDRHPTMSRHPITPMLEADLRLVLQLQGTQEISLINILDLQQRYEVLWEILLRKLENNPEVVLFDALTQEDSLKIGKLLIELQKSNPVFVVGSSGVETALAASSLTQNLGSRQPRAANYSLRSAEQILVISGSCSPGTEQQINWALTHGFEGIHISLLDIINSPTPESKLLEISNLAVEKMLPGKSLVIYTALGPNDPSIKLNQNQLIEHGFHISDTGRILGTFLGKLAKKIIQEIGVKRLVFAGGDTSSYATRQLGINAMEMITSVAPGAPLCRCHSNDIHLDGLELVLKGGQFGKESYFTEVLEMH